MQPVTTVNSPSLAPAPCAAYPLSPMQQGMLFHYLLGASSGVDIEQLVCSLSERLDLTKLRTAWERVVRRHAVLRTGFRWQDLETPLQEVWEDVALPWAVVDWRSLSAAEQEQRLAAFLRQDRARGFVLSDAPFCG